jgi:uncharacterized protein
LRAVLDPNVLVSALLSASGTPAELIRRWLAGDFELVLSAKLVGELERVLRYPKITARISAAQASEIVDVLRDEGLMADDPVATVTRGLDDPEDEYLIALAVASGAALVSGDRHLTDLPGRLPIFTPAEFLDLLDERRPQAGV